MEARVARPRFTLAMISLAGFFQMNGVGFSFQPSAQMPISSCRWATEVNAPPTERLRNARGDYEDDWGWDTLDLVRGYRGARGYYKDDWVRLTAPLLACKACGRIVARWHFGIEFRLRSPDFSLWKAETPTDTSNALLEFDDTTITVDLAIPRFYYRPHQPISVAQSRYIEDICRRPPKNGVGPLVIQKSGARARHPAWNVNRLQVLPAYFEFDWSYLGKYRDPKLHIWCHPKKCQRRFSVWASRLVEFKYSSKESVTLYV